MTAPGLDQLIATIRDSPAQRIPVRCAGLS